MPFGKYKGYPLDVLRHDQDYSSWLAAQEWLPESYPEVSAFLASLGTRPKLMCKAVTLQGDACPYWAKFGMLCGVHYRQAERSALKVPA